MEVHAHTHSPDPESHRGKKKFSHYLWEFLMLFLAVFCGFLAENQREHIVEHQRESKYMASFYEDLKNDTVNLKDCIRWWDNTLERIDTIRMEIEKPPEKRNTILLYQNVANMRNYNSFIYHNRTIEQLKNAGNFRLIRSSSISDSLIDYDAIIHTVLMDQQVQSNAIYQQINFLQDKIFNSRYFYLRSNQKKSQMDSVYKLHPEVFIIPVAAGPDLLQYYNDLEYYYRMNFYRLHAMENLLQRANNLIEQIKKQYQLK
jgi:hypothetical protein